MVKYTGADVQREAEAHKEWARKRDREQFHEVTRAQMQAHDEMRNQELKARDVK